MFRFHAALDKVRIIQIWEEFRMLSLTGNESELSMHGMAQNTCSLARNFESDHVTCGIAPIQEQKLHFEDSSITTVQPPKL